MGNTKGSIVLTVLCAASASAQSPTPQQTAPEKVVPAPAQTAAPAQTTAPAKTSAAPAAQSDKPTIKPEELEQMLAPIALYPDALLTQMFMAATYPLEIVEADRWVKAHKDLKGDPLATALEKEKWDPAVKSLVNFPPVLEMLSTKLDWTQKLGDAFLGQQKELLDTVQKLRAKAKENGQLESNKDQKITVEEQGTKEIIIIESAKPEVIYVPTYDPVVVYGTWAYPAYPPYPYYPYYPPGAAAFTFAVGVAWGYAWGGCNWGSSDVDIDINRNTNINTKIDRDKYKNQGNLKDGKGNWKHDSKHRGNVPYRDSKTAGQHGGKSASDAARSRDAYRGRAETGRNDLNRGAADQMKSPGATDRAAAAGRDAASRPSNTASSGARGSSSSTRASSKSSGSKSGAFDGASRGGSTAKAQSSRGRSSRGGGGGGRGGGRR